MDVDVVLKRFGRPDEVHEFELGRFELVTLGGMTIGRATNSLAGSGPSMSGQRSAKPPAMSSMLAWSFQDARRRRWTVARSSRCAQVTSSASSALPR